MTLFGLTMFCIILRVIEVILFAPQGEMKLCMSLREKIHVQYIPLSNTALRCRENGFLAWPLEST